MRAHRQRAAWLAAVLLSLGVLLSGNAFDRPSLVQNAQRQGPVAAQRLTELLQEMDGAMRIGEEEKIRRVNDFFNRRVAFSDDRVNWGAVDYWATPLETLHRGQGDCEDYAIAKYFSLIAMGVAPAKMRMVYVRAQLGGTVQAHMVLAYYPQPLAEPLILDNLISDVRPASRRPDLAPVFSFNAEGLWQGVGEASAGNPVVRLSRWRDLLNKTKAEGWW